MSNKELSDFVQQSLARGESREQIITTLTQQGWQAGQINEALGGGSMPAHSRKPLYIAIFVLILLLIGGAFALYNNKTNKHSTENNYQVYVAGKGDKSFSFRYPNEYCAFEDGQINVAYGADCNNPSNEKYLYIMFLPAFEANGIDDFIKNKFDGLFTDTGTRKNIGEYEAHEVDLKPSGTGYLFLIDRNTAVLVSSHLKDSPGAAEAYEMVLSSLAFGDKAETPLPNARPKAENFNPVGARAIGFIGRVDISPDDQEIIFSYSHDGSVVNLYTANADGSNVKKIEPKNKPARYFPIEPRYSHDGTKILFVSRDQGWRGPKGIAYVMDRDGSNLKGITKDDENVLEAVFAKDDQSIYYLRANAYKNYNGMAPDLPHEIDVYQVNLNGSGFRQISDQKNYELAGLSLSPDGTLLAFGGNMYSFTKTPPYGSDLPCAYKDSSYVFYQREASYLCINNAFDKGTLVKTAIGASETSLVPFTPQKVYPYSPVFFHSKNTILFFERDGAFPQKLYLLNLDEPMPSGSPLPDEDLRTKEIPIAVP